MMTEQCLLIIFDQIAEAFLIGGRISCWLGRIGWPKTKQITGMAIVNSTMHAVRRIHCEIIYYRRGAGAIIAASTAAGRDGAVIIIANFEKMLRQHAIGFGCRT